MAPLIDPHSRQIRYIRLSVTDRCNFRCRYCMPSGGFKWIPHQDIMRYEEFLRILGLFVSRGVEKVRITGGEPLLRKGLMGFIESVKAMGGLNDLSLTTNGVLLLDKAEDLRRAGLDRINISLDTLDKKRFAYITRVDAFGKVFAGIHKALEVGFSPVKINVVAMKGFNDDEILSFTRMAYDLPIEVRFIELMPMGCTSRFKEFKILGFQEIAGIIQGEYGHLEPLENGLGPARVFELNGGKGRIGIIGSMSDNHVFCDRCNRVRITADGRLVPCLFSDVNVDILNPMRSGATDSDLFGLIELCVKMKPFARGMSEGQAMPTLLDNVEMSAIGG